MAILNGCSDMVYAYKGGMKKSVRVVCWWNENKRYRSAIPIYAKNECLTIIVLDEQRGSRLLIYLLIQSNWWFSMVLTREMRIVSPHKQVRSSTEMGLRNANSVMRHDLPPVLSSEMSPNSIKAQCKVKIFPLENYNRKFALIQKEGKGRCCGNRVIMIWL